MTSRERVKTVLSHKPPDKIPLGFFSIDCDTVEKILGHDTYLRAKAKSQIAFWEGKRDEVVESWKNDFIELYKKLDIIDIINLSPMTTAFAPPKNYKPEAPKKIDETTWELKDGTILKYSDLTKDLTIARKSNDEMAFKTYEEKDYNFEEEIVPPDKSQFEVVDAILDAFKDDNKYIIGAGFDEGIFTPPADMEYYDHPEWVTKACKAALKRANAMDKYVYKKEYDGVMWGADFSYNSGPFISPQMFREFLFPYIKSRVENVKRYGLDVHKHACGNNWKLMDMFIEMGYDAYQSIQESAGMDTKKVKELYGDKLTLWAGPQVETLTSGTTEDIKKEVRKFFEIAGDGSGFIFSTSHSVAVGTKYENFMTMLDEFKKLNDRYFL
ncbi:MAG TPA: uroporphyrinogen decarboxylase family protein [Ignavibacteria bacterium]